MEYKLIKEEVLKRLNETPEPITWTDAEIVGFFHSIIEELLKLNEMSIDS
jgi:hypothetical protein